MLEQHDKKKSEYAEWSAVVNSAVNQKDAAAKEAVLAFQKMKKRVIRFVNGGCVLNEGFPSTFHPECLTYSMRGSSMVSPAKLHCMQGGMLHSTNSLSA